MMAGPVSGSRAMDGMNSDFEAACRTHLQRFFAKYPTSVDPLRADKVLRLLRASSKPLKGKAEGWAAGIIYFVATDGEIACGVRDVLNAEFASFMGISMETARYRAARVREIVLLEE